jgi:hypothetical protein
MIISSSDRWQRKLVIHSPPITSIAINIDSDIDSDIVVVVASNSVSMFLLI